MGAEEEREQRRLPVTSSQHVCDPVGYQKNTHITGTQPTNLFSYRLTNETDNGHVFLYGQYRKNECLSMHTDYVTFCSKTEKKKLQKATMYVLLYIYIYIWWPF